MGAVPLESRSALRRFDQLGRKEADVGRDIVDGLPARTAAYNRNLEGCCADLGASARPVNER
jgi:FixJ family two-component response regulator